jgi:FkbM family methyltransferase
MQLQSVKDYFWRILAYCLSVLAFRIRRQPSPRSAYEWRCANFSYSHFGEDLIVAHLLNPKIAAGIRGWYVDVGAFDPVSFSNTLLLHQRGWKGINIDANPARIEAFQRLRPTDVNIVAAVSDGEQTMDYLFYQTGGLNRVVPPGSTGLKNQLAESPLRVERINTETLSAILKRHLPAEASVDFLNIDCEGHDLSVLSSLDWNRWAPEVIAVEGNTRSEREAILAFLTNRGYEMVSLHIVTMIFSRTHPSSFGKLSDSSGRD